MKTTLLVIALFLQVVGVAVTAYGLHHGWKEVRKDDRLLDRARELGTNAGIAIRRFGRKFIRRKKLDVPSARGSVHATAPMLSAGGMGGKVSNNPVSRDQDVWDALDVLNDRINESLAKIVAVKTESSMNNRKMRTDLSSLEQSLSAALVDHQEAQRQRSVTGLRIEMCGFALLALGSLLSGSVSAVTG